MTDDTSEVARPRWRWVVAFGCALLAALAACAWQAVAIARFRDPQPTFHAGIGDTTLINGSTFRLDTFTVAERLPAKEPGEPPVAAMPDAVLVQAILTVEVLDPDRDRTTIWCDFLLVDDQGRQWRPDSDIEYEVAGPEAVTCTGAYDDKIKLRRPIQVGRVFQVPAGVADQVQLRLGLAFEEEMIEFRH